MSSVTFDEINQIIRRHMEERDWHDNPARGLAISIVLEASELLEHYQWSDDAVGKREALAEEIADILIYTLQFADQQGIDVPTAIKAKLDKAAKKYPANHFKGKPKGAMREQWLKDKLSHKKDGL